MHPKHEQYPDQQSQPWTYRFEMVKTAVDVLASFSSELCECTPPELPEHLESVCGWTIRFDGLGEYARQVPSAQLESIAKRLDEPIASLAAYIDRWEANLSKIDPFLVDYEIMGDDEDAVDSVRVLFDRAVYAQQLATGELNNRR
jgi:hypothetical protein